MYLFKGLILGGSILITIAVIITAWDGFIHPVGIFAKWFGQLTTLMGLMSFGGLILAKIKRV